MSDLTIRLRTDVAQDGGLVVRTAAKEHRCQGDGSSFHRRTRECEEGGEIIAPGDQYLDVLWEAPAWSSGDAVCRSCSLEFYSDYVQEA